MADTKEVRNPIVDRRIEKGFYSGKEFATAVGMSYSLWYAWETGRVTEPKATSDYEFQKACEKLDWNRDALLSAMATVNKFYNHPEKYKVVRPTTEQIKNIRSGFESTGNPLVDWRLRNNVSVEDLADTLHVSKEFMEAVEDGREMAAPDLATDIIDLTDLKLQDVLGLYREPKPVREGVISLPDEKKEDIKQGEVVATEESLADLAKIINGEEKQPKSEKLESNIPDLMAKAKETAKEAWAYLQTRKEPEPIEADEPTYFYGPVGTKPETVKKPVSMEELEKCDTDLVEVETDKNWEILDIVYGKVSLEEYNRIATILGIRKEVI